VLNYDLLAVTATASTPQIPDGDEVVALKRALALAHLQIQDLKEQLRLERIKKYGPGSEKLSDAQLALLELEPGVKPCRSPGGKRSRAAAGIHQPEAPSASGPAGVAR